MGEGLGRWLLRDRMAAKITRTSACFGSPQTLSATSGLGQEGSSRSRHVTCPPRGIRFPTELLHPHPWAFYVGDDLRFLQSFQQVLERALLFFEHVAISTIVGLMNLVGQHREVSFQDLDEQGSLWTLIPCAGKGGLTWSGFACRKERLFDQQGIALSRRAWAGGFPGWIRWG